MRGRERERDVIKERRIQYNGEDTFPMFSWKISIDNNGPKEICRQEVFQICVKC